MTEWTGPRHSVKFIQINGTLASMPMGRINPMKKIIFIPVFLLFITLTFTGEAKAVGEACQSDADCKGGICFDLSKITDVCKGKVCTITCSKNADCPKVAKEPQCGSVEGKKICQYGDWDKKYCQ